MSRTIRRKSFIPDWVVSPYKDIPTEGFKWGYDCTEEIDPSSIFGVKHHYTRVATNYPATLWVRVPLKGKELKKAVANYHGDTVRMGNPPKYFRKMENKSYRNQCREELVRYLQNPEYEVMIIPRPKLPYWD